MLSRTPDFHAQLERVRLDLKAAVAKSKPSRATKLETLLRETREMRTSQSARIGKLYAAHREANPGQPATEEILKADATLVDLDAQVGKLRVQLERERGLWAPELFRTIDAHTKLATPAIEQCVAVLEATATLYAEVDASIANGFQSRGSPKAGQFADIIVRLRRLIKAGSK